MQIHNNPTPVDAQEIGDNLYKLITDLFPICRSITGNGVRQSLQILQQHIPLTIHEVPTGSQVFDWTVPREWNIREAYIKNAQGQKVVDFNNSNLHVLNYSVPVHKKVSLAELKQHLFTLPGQPDLIPYRTSYYNENWGFCLSHNQFLKLDGAEYEVYIDSSLEDGHLTYGEYFIKGELTDEVLISCHICHPSLCNDNLSGNSIAALLAKHLTDLPLRYSYRFLFIPGTIGAITWLALNEKTAFNIKHGLVTTLLGNSGNFTYKKSRRGNAEIDKIVEFVLKSHGKDCKIIDFFPYGYDERQYCSPGFNLPVGCLMRTPHGEFPEYHTSADNLDFVSPVSLAEAFFVYTGIIDTLENNRTYINLNPKCEPQLGKRGLYKAISGQADNKSREMAMLWLLNLSDGEHSLLDIAQKSSISIEVLKNIADILQQHELLKEYTEA
jgi:aminopeptidase-like protein